MKVAVKILVNARKLEVFTLVDLGAGGKFIYSKVVNSNKITEVFVKSCNTSCLLMEHQSETSKAQ